MRSYRLSICVAVIGLLLLPAALLAQDAGERGARGGGGRGGAGAAGGGRGGRGRAAAPPSAPTPHWTDGRVNLDAAPGQKGFWNVMPLGLTESALEAFKQWKFQPGTMNGKPVAVSLNVEVNFGLEKQFVPPPPQCPVPAR